jgi:hypothetical protein
VTTNQDLLTTATTGYDRGVVPDVPVEEAARLLADSPTIPPPSPDHRGFRPSISSPVDFATFGESGLSNWFDSIMNSACAEEFAAYKLARSKMLSWLPLLGETDTDSPWWKLDEAVMTLMCRAFLAGIRGGASFENLRLALLGSKDVCRGCNGHGRLPAKSAVEPTMNDSFCGMCGGTGLVPVPGVRAKEANHV